GDLRGARLLPNPELEFSAEQLEPGADFGSAQLDLSLRQLLLTGGRMSRRIRAATRTATAAGWGYFEAGAALAAEARGALYRVLAAHELVEITGEQRRSAAALVVVV